MVKADKILDNAVKLKVDDIIKDKINREDKENNWTMKISKKKKRNWTIECYLADRLADLIKLENEIRTIIFEYRKTKNRED